MELVIEDLSKSFGERQVLQNISFTFSSGKIYGLLGRNGAGKTTFFNCLNGDIKRDSGKLYLLSSNQKRPIQPDDIGYVLSTPTVPAFLTGREFLKFFLDINEANISNLKTVDEYFEEIAINVADRDKLLKDYSHGMKNKMQMLVNMIVCPPVLLLMQMLVNMIVCPPVLLLDEPLTALDVVVAEEMKQFLRTLKQHSIIILSTHIMDLALNLCDEIVLLNHGLLEHMELSDLNSEAFKEKIIFALREGTE